MRTKRKSKGQIRREALRRKNILQALAVGLPMCAVFIYAIYWAFTIKQWVVVSTPILIGLFCVSLSLAIVWTLRWSKGGSIEKKPEDDALDYLAECAMICIGLVVFIYSAGYFVLSNTAFFMPGVQSMYVSDYTAYSYRTNRSLSCKGIKVDDADEGEIRICRDRVSGYVGQRGDVVVTKKSNAFGTVPLDVSTQNVEAAKERIQNSQGLVEASSIWDILLKRN